MVIAIYCNLDMSCGLLTQAYLAQQYGSQTADKRLQQKKSRVIAIYCN